MSRVRLYVDEDAGERIVVDGLARAGFDILTAQQAGARQISDEAQLNIAATDGRALYSLNVADFSRLHAEWMTAGRSHAGIVLIPRQRYSGSEKLRRLAALLASLSAERFVDRIEFL